MDAKAAFRLKLATPCRTSWSQMSGDDKVRFCGLCNKNVYNLSTMSRDDAVGLVRAKEGELCATFFQRGDGTVMTSDCQVGVRRARFAMAAAASLLLVIFVAPMLFMRRTGANGSHRTWDTVVDEVRDLPVVGALVNWVSPDTRRMMGGIRSIP